MWRYLFSFLKARGSPGSRRFSQRADDFLSCKIPSSVQDRGHNTVVWCGHNAVVTMVWCHSQVGVRESSSQGQTSWLLIQVQPFSLPPPASVSPSASPAASRLPLNVSALLTAVASSAEQLLAFESFLMLAASVKKTSLPVTMLAQAITIPAAFTVTSLQLLLVFLTMISSASLSAMALLDFFLWLFGLSASRCSSTWPRSAELEWTPVTESEEGMLVRQRGRVEALGWFAWLPLPVASLSLGPAPPAPPAPPPILSLAGAGPTAVVE